MTGENKHFVFSLMANSSSNSTERRSPATLACLRFLNWTRLSCRNFRDNQVRLQLLALAYNLENFLRRLALPRSVKHWSLITLREKLIKIGAKDVRHSKYAVFQMAEVAVPRELFAAILDRIQRFGVPQPLVQRG